MTGRPAGGNEQSPVVVAMILALTLIAAAGCTRVISGQGHPVGVGAVRPTPTFASSSAPSSTPTARSTPTASATDVPSASATVATPTPGPSSTGAVVSCPTVSDAVARIRYSCITTGMRSIPTPGYGITVARQTETSPAWYMAESSLAIDAFDADSLKSAAQDELDQFLEDNYPEGSDGTASAEKTTTVDGHSAYEFIGLITVDKSAPAYKSLQANQDRVVSIAILRGDGTAAMLIIAVPDTNKTLWPKMETIATSARLF